MLSYNLKILIYGFPNRLNGREPVSILPYLRLIGGSNYSPDKIRRAEFLIYILICLVLYFLGAFIYRKRKIEGATQSIVFMKLKYVFKYGVAFCAMSLIGFYFQQTQKDIHWILTGYLLGSALGYFIAEMVIQKSFIVYKAFKGYLIYAGVIVILMLGLKVDILGFESNVPPVQNVKSVSFDMDNYNSYNYVNSVNYFTNKNNLKYINKLHKQILKDKSLYKYRNNNLDESIVLNYRLNNGDKIIREYFVPSKTYETYFEPIYGSKESKYMNSKVLTVDTKDIESITIKNTLGLNKQATLLDQSQISAAIKALRSDILKETYEEMYDNRKVPLAGIMIKIKTNALSKYFKQNNANHHYNETQIYENYESHYKAFDDWIIKNNLEKNSKVLPTDINYIIVKKINNKEEFRNIETNVTAYVEHNPGIIKITDKNLIKACLKNCEYTTWDSSPKYSVIFCLNDKTLVSQDYCFISEVPALLKNSVTK